MSEFTKDGNCCACGFPQSFPIPHKHDQTQREKAIIKHFRNSHEALLEALEQIRDLETECCPRCEGNGRLYADGKGHLISENAPTILCGNCGGSGRILPEDAQEIAEAAIAAGKEQGK